MIELNGLSYRYGGPAGTGLRFAPLQLPQGGCAVLLGPSGSGKSTLLALLAGLLTPASGELTVAGADLARMGARERDAWRARCLGFLPQRLHLSESLTVFDNVALALWAADAGGDAGRVHATLESLGLAGLARRRPHELSVGQAQRVALARAVVRRPAVLLADEPTASLDDAAAAAALEVLQQVAGEAGATLVVATHDQRVRDALGARALEVRLA